MYSSLNIYNQPVTLAPTTVASPNAAYQRMANFWGLVEDLKEGTYKIRSEHRKYLPQEARETDDSYDVRLSRSTVVPYLQRIEKMLSGMLVRKPINTPSARVPAVTAATIGGVAAAAGVIALAIRHRRVVRLAG